MRAIQRQSESESSYFKETSLRNYFKRILLILLSLQRKNIECRNLREIQNNQKKFQNGKYKLEIGNYNLDHKHLTLTT